MCRVLPAHGALGVGAEAHSSLAGLLLVIAQVREMDFGMGSSVVYSDEWWPRAECAENTGSWA